jgi:cytosine/adenosine deaminase-related metal-dependent hydrolase
MLVGLHLDEGFSVRFPAQHGNPALETWEEWSECDFLAPDGTIEGPAQISQAMLAEAKEVLRDAEDGCHLHLHEGDE